MRGVNGKNMSLICDRHMKEAVLNIGQWDLYLPFLIFRSCKMKTINKLNITGNI